MMELTTQTKVNDALAELEASFFDIPFGNSDFQTEAFVIASQTTPERAYRALGVNIHSKLQVLQSHFFDEQRLEVDIDELREKLSQENLDKFARRRTEISLNEKLTNKSFMNKLKNDCIRELEVMYKHFKALPKYTREQFEAAESDHFKTKMQRQALGITGPKESLVNMAVDMPALAKYEEEISSLEQLDSQTLELLRLQMPIRPTGEQEK